MKSSIFKKDLFSQALHKKEIFVDSLFKRPESLGQLLPYNEYNKEKAIFIQKDGSLGAVYEANLIEHETLTVEQTVHRVERLKSWFALPTNCTLQILYEQYPISEFDKVFDGIRNYAPNPHPVSKLILESKVKAIQEVCNKDAPQTPLKRRLLVSIRYFPEKIKLGFSKDILKSGEAILMEESKDFIQECRNFSQLLSNFETNSQVELKRLCGDDLTDILRRFLNPKTYYKRGFAPFNENIPISDQILFHNPVLDFSGIEREGIKTKTLSLKTSPQYAYPGGMAYFTMLNFPFKLSLNFQFPSRRQTKSFFDIKEFFLQNTPSERAKRQREEVLEVQAKLAREDRCLHLTFNVILEAESDEILEKRVREVANIFNNDLECEAIVEKDIGLGLCLNSLPLNYEPRSDYSSQRFIRILRSDATKFLPVFDSFRGLRNPLQVYLSRENNLINYNLLENETSNHTVVLADSGSGKSAFVLDCIQSAKRLDPEPLVFVIDKKSSYVMLSEYFDGDLTVFDRNGEMPFSPFRGHYDDEKIAFLTHLIASAIRLESPNFSIEADHTTAISKSLKLAYLKKLKQMGMEYVEKDILIKDTDAEVELSMDDFITELAQLPSEEGYESYKDTCNALTQKLRNFYDGGIYAKYFKGTTNKRKASKSFYIYDLDSLDTDPILQALMTMSVMEEIRRIIKLPENRGRLGFIVLEELGMLGRNNPTAGPFIVDYAETGRKLGYWLISLTPRPQNYFELEVGKAMWGVADNFVFLQMSSDNVDYLKKHSTILDEATSEIVKSLRTKRGFFADIFSTDKKKSKAGAFRYHQTPLDRWLAPSNAKDSKEAAKAIKKFEDDKWKALAYLMEKFPRGVENALEQTGEA